MKYLKRIFFVLVALVASIVLFPLVVIDIVCFAVFFVYTGKSYADHYHTLLIAVLNWVGGNGWSWRIPQDDVSITTASNDYDNSVK